MAATSLSTPISQGFDGSDTNCVIDTEPPSVLTLPGTLRIFFDPAQNLALFRFRITVNTSREPLFLDILPNQIQSLDISLGPPRCLHFRVADITLVGPKHHLLRLERADRPIIDALRSFAQRKAIRVSLTETGDNLPQLDGLREGVNRGTLRPDPEQTNLKSLYRGEGGRIISLEELSLSLLDQPPVTLFSIPPAEDELPTYTDLAPPPPTLPGSPKPSKKRCRSRSLSFSLVKSPSPSYQTCKHLDLVYGEREKMSELLRRADCEAKKLKELVDLVEAKERCVDDMIARLSGFLQWAEGGVQGTYGLHPSAETEQQIYQAQTNPNASQISTASASSPTSTAASTSSHFSDRVQAYVATQLDQLRNELVDTYATREALEEVRDTLGEEYVTAEDVERRIVEQVDLILNQHVEEHQMSEAIREAIDQAIDEVRSRVLAAWE